MLGSVAKLSVWIALGALLAFGPGGCRSPGANDSWSPDGGSFDAGEDDAGPGALCPPDTPDLFHNAHSPYLGGEESVDLEVVNFSYFRCPHCASFAAYSRDLWDSNQEIRDRVRIFFHHFPFTGEEKWRVHASTVAAANQGMEHFWSMHDYLYDGLNGDPQVAYDPDELRVYAEEVLGLDMVQYDADMDAEITWGFLEWDKAQLQALGYTSTPSVFVCGEKVGWDDVEDVVNSYL
jgi:protein-disulfide isomerase